MDACRKILYGRYNAETLSPAFLPFGLKPHNVRARIKGVGIVWNSGFTQQNYTTKPHAIWRGTVEWGLARNIGSRDVTRSSLQPGQNFAETVQAGLQVLDNLFGQIIRL